MWEEVATRSEEAERHAEILRMMVDGVGEDTEERDDLEIVDISPACEKTIFGSEENMSIHVTGTTGNKRIWLGRVDRWTGVQVSRPCWTDC